MKRGRSKENIYWGAFILKWFHYLQNSNFTAADYKVLFLLCSEIDPRSNKIYLKQKQIAEKLYMDKSNVSKTIKKLCKEQFILKIQNGFIVNPHLFYVGKARREDREILREEFDELIKDNICRFTMDEDEGRLKENADYPEQI